MDETLAAESQEHEATAHAVGDRIGTYELVARLGEGGMGEVWEARHSEIGKRVAVKFLFPKLASDPTFVERFRREAMATANLDHPSICRALDFATTPFTYLVLDFVDGEPLSKVIADQKGLEISRAKNIAVQICEGLAAAHAIGIVHRDLKPENVMLIEGGLKILDFGIAASFGKEENQRLTQTGQAIGTPTYMSPEQIAARNIGPHSDQYALGVLLFELLSGKPPFESDIAFEILEAHVRTEAPKISDVRPDVPQSLSKIIARLLEKEPKDRFASITDVSQALKDADLTVQPAERKPVSVPTKPIVIGVAGVLLLAVVVAGIFAFKSSIGSEVEQKKIVEQRQKTLSEERGAALKGIVLETAGDIAKLPPEKQTNIHVRSLEAELLGTSGKLNEALDIFAEISKEDSRYLAYPPTVDFFEKCISAKNCKTLAPRGWDLANANAKPIREMLFSTAATNTRSKTRKLASDALTQFGAEPTMEAWQKEALVLTNGKTCERRIEAISVLKKSDAAMAESVLQAVSERPRKGCGFLKMKDCISCLRQPLKEALGE